MLSNISISNKIGIGFIFLLIIFSGYNLFTLSELRVTNASLSAATEVQVPTVGYARELTRSIGLANELLRDSVLFKSERHEAQHTEVWESIQQSEKSLQDLSEGWAIEEDRKLLKTLVAILEEYTLVHNEIAEVAQHPSNIRAFEILDEQALPLFRQMMEEINALIALEKKQRNNTYRAFVLEALADIQGNLASSVDSIRAFLHSRENDFISRYSTSAVALLKTTEALSDDKVWLSDEQNKHLANFNELLRKFRPLPEQIFYHRRKDDWNTAVFLLQSEAIPLENELYKVLDQLVTNKQLQLSTISHQILVENKLIETHALVALFASVMLAIGTSIYVSRSVLAPITEAINLANRIAKGELRKPVDANANTQSRSKPSASELELLTQSLWQMEDQLVDLVESLRKREAELLIYKQIFDATNDYYLVLYPGSWRYLTANKKLLDNFNIEDNPELRSLCFKDFVGEKYFSKDIEPRLEKCFSGGLGQYTDWRKLPSGDSVYLQTQYYAIHTENDVKAVVINARDLTDFKLADEKLEKTLENLKSTQSKLVQSSKMASIGVLASGVAHELNQPLTFIKGLSQLELEHNSDLPENLKQTLTLIVDGTLRMQGIIDHLREFSRQADIGAHQNVLPDELINDSLVLIRTQITARGITLDINCSENLPQLFVNKHRIEQVFINLLSNARDALEDIDSPKIQVNVSASADFVIFEFVDNGSGMTEDAIENAFDPFYTTKEIGKGTGLGLSVSYDIVAEHDGDLTISSQLNGGTTVLVKLPVKPKHQANELMDNQTCQT